MLNKKEDESYLNLVTQKIELDKLLYNLPKEKQIIAKKLIEKRNSIRKQNRFFAEYRINLISKKINKLFKD